MNIIVFIRNARPCMRSSAIPFCVLKKKENENEEKIKKLKKMKKYRCTTSSWFALLVCDLGLKAQGFCFNACSRRICFLRSNVAFHHNQPVIIQKITRKTIGVF